MVIVRIVFQANFGQGGALATAMAERLAAAAPTMRAAQHWRILTDLSGPFDTVVLELEAESLAAHEQARAELFASPEFQANVGRTAPMVVGGRNEFYTLEAQG